MIKNGMRPVHPGEVLREDFLVPLGTSANARSWLNLQAAYDLRVADPKGHRQPSSLLAKRLKKSRSSRYAEAVAGYVARHEPEAVTEALNQVAKKLDTKPDGFASAAARRVLEGSRW